MIKLIFQIFDMKMKCYLPPMFVRAEGEAIRAFQDAVNDPHPQNKVSTHPEDFALYHTGSWNDVTGEIISFENFKSYGKAADYLKAQVATPVPQPQGGDVGERGKKAAQENTNVSV